MVIEAIREIVRNEEYAQAIKKRIGVQIDTKAVDKELEGYQAKLKEVDLNKTRLEREIDSLPADAKYRERKLHDMTLRLDSLYDVIVELEEKIEDARLRRDAIKQQAITLENIYKIMVNFDCVYNIINDEEKRNVVTALIKEIEIYRNDESEYPLKRIGLNFPVFKDGGEVTELLWDKGNTVDAVNALAEKFKAADGLVLASPVYFASANATLVACLDRLFYSTSFDKTMKVGASVVCGRRGGCSATFDELNKYFTISGMPIASGQYWNSIHGRAAGEAELDEEGRQSMRTLARNMTFLMKSIALGKEKFGLPEKEEPIATNFIR